MYTVVKTYYENSKSYMDGYIRGDQFGISIYISIYIFRNHHNTMENDIKEFPFNFNTSTATLFY